MPNNVRNQLVISGEPNIVAEVLAHIKADPIKDGSQQPIDFNKIIPMPKELAIESSTFGSVGYGVLYGKGVVGHFYEPSFTEKTFLSWRYEERQKSIKLAQQYHENVRKYGHATFYSWCIEKWGTKWNAYNQEIAERGELLFDTASTSALKVIYSLSCQFPKVKIFHNWSDEDAGANCGKSELQGGIISFEKLENYSDAAWNLFFELHPNYRKYYEQVDGKWQHMEEEEEL